MYVRTVIIFFSIITHFSSTGVDTSTCLYATIPKIHKSPCVENSLCSTQEEMDKELSTALKKSKESKRKLNEALYALPTIKEKSGTPPALAQPMSDYNSSLKKIKDIILRESDIVAKLSHCSEGAKWSEKCLGGPEGDVISNLYTLRAEKFHNLDKLQFSALEWNKQISKMSTNDSFEPIDLSTVRSAQIQYEDEKEKFKIVSEKNKKVIVSSTKRNQHQHICVSNVTCTLRGVEYKLHGVHCPANKKQCPKLAEECVDTPAQIFSDFGKAPKNAEKITAQNKKQKIIYDADKKSAQVALGTEDLTKFALQKATDNFTDDTGTSGETNPTSGFDSPGDSDGATR